MQPVCSLALTIHDLMVAMSKFSLAPVHALLVIKNCASCALITFDLAMVDGTAHPTTRRRGPACARDCPGRASRKSTSSKPFTDDVIEAAASILVIGN
ncbi:hypothetical protein AB0N24_25640 [Arthrobacter sp. NPDC093128]|uniref:hypothetical protein n=1 Tax=Arthrobacter sp. NPDC093128 TaxID=3154979 RepID=UPI003428BEA0